jgi:transcriptional regulator with GAF, ATPase, and Fis domain
MSRVFDRAWNGRIGLADLPPAVRGAVLNHSGAKFHDHLGALEYEALREELGRQKGNMAKTAGALGLTPRQVSWRIRKYGLNPGKFKPGAVRDQPG